MFFFVFLLLIRSDHFSKKRKYFAGLVAQRHARGREHVGKIEQITKSITFWLSIACIFIFPILVGPYAQFKQLKDQPPNVDLTNQLNQANGEIKLLVRQKGELVDLLKHAVPVSDTTADQVQHIVDRMTKWQAEDTNASLAEIKEQGRQRGEVVILDNLMQQKQGIQPAYPYWSVAVSGIQDDFKDIAQRFPTNDFSITNFPDINFAAQSIANGPFSGHIATWPSRNLSYAYSARGVPNPQFFIWWNEMATNTGSLNLNYDQWGKTFNVRLIVDGIEIANKTCPMTNEDECSDNLKLVLDLLKEENTSDIK